MTFTRPAIAVILLALVQYLHIAAGSRMQNSDPWKKDANRPAAPARLKRDIRFGNGPIARENITFEQQITDTVRKDVEHIYALSYKEKPNEVSVKWSN